MHTENNANKQQNETNPAVEILCEAEAFENYGGWLLDSQFEESMGSPYLLAHGLGKPVQDATTTVNIAESGAYRVWVRTKDWVPEYHPGRFELHVNGQRLGGELGASGQDWGWQLVGAVRLAHGPAKLALHDLTGFEGRCDAVFLTLSDEIPPETGKQVSRACRKRLLGLPDMPVVAGEFDVIVDKE